MRKSLDEILHALTVKSCELVIKKAEVDLKESECKLRTAEAVERYTLAMIKRERNPLANN